MAVNLKSYFKLSILYTVISAFPPMLQLLIQPLIEGADRLDATDFSQMAIAESIGVIAMVLCALAMGNALVRFYYDHMDDHRSFSVLASGTFNSMLFRGGILLLLGFLFKDQIGALFSQPALRDFGSYGLASIGIGISRAINIAAANLFRNQKKVSHFVWLSLAMGLIRTAFQLAGLFFYEMSFKGYVFGSCVGGALVTAGVLIYTWSHYGFHYSRTAMKPLYAFAFPLFQYILLTWGLRFIDRFFLESQPVELGIYDTAMKFALGIELILIGLNGAARPEVFRFMKKGTEKHRFDIKRISNIMIAQIQVVIGLVVFPVMLYLSWFYETQIRYASEITTIVFVRYIMQAQYLVFLLPVYYAKRTKALFWINSLALMSNILLNYFLIPVYGYYGAITSALITQFLLVQMMFFYQKNMSGIDWNLKKVYYHPLMIVLIAVIGERMKTIMEINTFIESGVIVVFIFASLYLLYGKDVSLKKIINHWHDPGKQNV